ncbi:hypothetical protein [Haloferula sp. BvORR071]|uniref:hypothetical protein n=1 Tax=Haloferula sp. BvORR071 TaxID=1396141 RepID=UPI0005529DC6|nr:hypothetical protein [Haloferula sp. BvORR071]
MKANPRTPFRLLACAGFIGAACAGWQLAGGSSAASATTSNSGTEARSSKAASRTERSVRESGPPPQARRQIAAIRGISSSKERMQATIALAYSLPASELGDWIDRRWFQSEPGFDLTLFNKIVNQRWQTEDPQGKLKLAMEAGEGYSMGAVESWAKQDPAALLAYFKENPNPNLEYQSLQAIAKANPTLALTRLRELIASGSPDNSGYYGNEALREIAAKAPEALAAALNGLPKNLRLQAEGMLLGKRLESDPTGELRALMQRPDGLTALERAFNTSGDPGKISDVILSDLTALPEQWRGQLGRIADNLINPDNAEKWFRSDFAAAGFTEDQVKNLKQTAIRNLSYQNPEQALKLMGEMELDPKVRENMLRNLFSYGHDAEKNEKMLALLSSDAERETAQKWLDRSSGRSEEVKAETPSEWLEQIQNYDPAKGNSYRYMSILAQWDKDKLAEVASGFRTLPADKKMGVATILAGDDNNSRGDPSLRGEAIRYLILNEAPAKPEEAQANDPFASRPQNATHYASSLAVQWGIKDPEAASQWVQGLPEGNAKLWAQKNLAANWAQYDPDGVQRWLSSFPAASRSEVEKFMKEPQ